MTQSISTEQTAENIEKVKAVLAATHSALEGLSQGLSAEDLRKALGPGERSITGDLAHLLHCEARSSEAVYLALLADQPAFADIHPERQFGKLLRYDLLDFWDLMGYFKIRRTLLLRVLEALPAAKWSRVVREEGKQRRESVYWRTRTIAMHELDHIGDLRKKLGA